METFAGRMTLMSLCFLLLHDARSPCIYPKNSIAVADSRMTTNCEQPAEEHPSIWLDFGDRQGRSQRWSAFLSRPFSYFLRVSECWLSLMWGLRG